MIQATVTITRYWEVQGRPVTETMEFVYDPIDPRSAPLPADVWAAQVPTIQAALQDGPLASYDGQPIYDVENLWCVMSRVLTYSSTSENPILPPDGDDLLWDRFAQGAISDFDVLARPVKRSARQLTREQFEQLTKELHEQFLAEARLVYAKMEKDHNEHIEAVSAALGPDVARLLVGDPIKASKVMYAALGDI